MCHKLPLALLMRDCKAASVFIAGIRKEVFPGFPTDTFAVTVPYPSSSPEEVEQGIVLKVEEERRDIIGIKEIRSTSQESVGVVKVEMEPDCAQNEPVRPLTITETTGLEST